ncbi:hypothetical protein CMI44_00535 [Candidatus Pacearchaeota archaeon]|jgi:SHS2 domain-containing protein|nr:hypothetical protein [Candidatus Pacearchaeota archaeon]|tara:strand:+ start:1069 stop:1488 length:420 start_codon:yes stop_codon:yes gene_type:complete
MKFKFLEHTADVKFQAFGNSLEEVFVNSAMALKKTIIGEEKIKVKESEEKRVESKGEDIEALLYDFLEEFLYLLDAEDFLISKIKELEINEKNLTLKAVISGGKASNYNFTNDVKAITFNGMFVKKARDKWVAQVVLDV